MQPGTRSSWWAFGSLAVGLVAAAAATGGWLVLEASRAPRQGELTLPGLVAPVEIRFDARARPHVRASSLGDAFFAQGFLHARDRLWQMELLRRAGRGRLAEALGKGILDADRELWRAGVPQLAVHLERQASSETLDRVRRYCDGVNAGLASLSVLPPELLLAGVAVREWETTDVFALGALLAYDSARNATNELLRHALSQVLSVEELSAFLPDERRFPDFPYVVPSPAGAPGSGGRATAPEPDPVVGRRPHAAALDTLARWESLEPGLRSGRPSFALGSNGWVVGPERSRSGRALFAFDSHDALGLPNLFYEVHLHFGSVGDGAPDGGGQIRGGSVPGLPGVINGFNGRVAWGLTNIGDTQDLFLERRHPDDPLRFHDGSAWVEARVESVSIPVAGESEPETLEIVHTHHGPLVQDDPPIALSWTAHRLGEHGLDALFDMNLATDWPTFRAALDRFSAPSTNVTYADADGRIAFRTAGLLPRRGRGRGLLPLPGDDPTASWRGVVPARDLPERVDPPEGFAAAANARVWADGAGALVSADNAPGYRIARLQGLLRARDDFEAADLRVQQRDWWNGQAERLWPALRPAIEGPFDGEAASALGRARSLLDDWAAEPVNDPARSAPLIFEHWYLALAERVFAERLGDELWARLLRRNYVLNHALDGLLLAAPDSVWWRGDRDGTIRAAFEAAVSGLADELGPVPSAWRWDARNAVVFSHELGSEAPPLATWLNRGPFPWGGGVATVGRARSRYARPGIVDSGATIRLVVELGEPLRAWSVIPGGQAGHPGDPHYDDQIGAWLDGTHDPLAPRPESVGEERLLRLLAPSPGSESVREGRSPTDRLSRLGQASRTRLAR